MMHLEGIMAIYLKQASLKTKLGVPKIISQYSIFMHIETECTLASVCSFVAICLPTPHLSPFLGQRVPPRQLFSIIIVGFQVSLPSAEISPVIPTFTTHYSY